MKVMSQASTPPSGGGVKGIESAVRKRDSTRLAVDLWDVAVTLLRKTFLSLLDGGFGW